MAFRTPPNPFLFTSNRVLTAAGPWGRCPAASGAALACWQRVKVLGAPAHAGGRDVCEALTGVKSTGHVLGVRRWPGRAAEPVLLPQKWGWGGDGDTQIAGALRAASQAWRRPLALLWVRCFPAPLCHQGGLQTVLSILGAGEEEGKRGLKRGLWQEQPRGSSWVV